MLSNTVFIIGSAVTGAVLGGVTGYLYEKRLHRLTQEDCLKAARQALEESNEPRDRALAAQLETLTAAVSTLTANASVLAGAVTALANAHGFHAKQHQETLQAVQTLKAQAAPVAASTNGEAQPSVS